MTPAERWRADLEAWAIPQPLLDAVDSSPYEWPVDLFRRRHRISHEHPPETLRIVADLLGPHGTLLDVGAGTGRASIPFAQVGHRVVGVEKSATMAAGLRDELAQLVGDYSVIEGSWPEAGEGLEPFDVVMSAHVAYDVQDISPFLAAMSGHARTGVVLEVTERHPWAPLAPYYRALHGLDRPTGPTVDDLAAVIESAVGVAPVVERWQRPGAMWFESWDEIEELFARRLVLPESRRHELEALIGPDVQETDGHLTVGPPDRTLATIWWRPDR